MVKIILSILTLVGVLVPTQPPKEHQVKAVFLYNFTQFVDWPESAFTSSDAPFIIGILGKDPFGAYLDETVRGERKNNHPLEVRRYNSVEEAKGCHILYISGYESARLKRTITETKSLRALTVSDLPNFAHQGGMIRLYTVEGKIQIRINADAVREANLSVSAKLMKLAEVVRTDQ